MANTATNAHRQDKGHPASSALETAKDVASAVGDKVDSGVSSVGSGMQSLAGTLRDKGPHSGVLGSAASGVASALDSSGRYLEEQGLSGIGGDTDLPSHARPVVRPPGGPPPGAAGGGAP